MYTRGRSFTKLCPEINYAEASRSKCQWNAISFVALNQLIFGYKEIERVSRILTTFRLGVNLYESK